MDFEVFKQSNTAFYWFKLIVDSLSFISLSDLLACVTKISLNLTEEIGINAYFLEITKIVGVANTIFSDADFENLRIRKKIG